MWTIIRLELWKQRKTFFSTLLVLVLGAGLPALLLPRFQKVGVRDAFSGAAAFLVFLLPLAVAFLGASAASSLRRSDEKIHEELLAVDPLIRIYGAFIVSFFCNACISILVLSLMGVPQVFTLVSLRFGFFQIPVEGMLVFVFSLHCLSFVISYLINLPFLGAGLALVLSIIDFFFRGMWYFFSGPYPELIYFVFSIPLLLVVFMPAFFGRRIERHQNLGLLRILVLFLCLSAVPVWSLIMTLAFLRVAIPY